jgi:hypothetical protein
MTVMIGVDPHKRSHTAVVIDDEEQPLASIEVRAGGSQVADLLGWSAAFADRRGRLSRRTVSAIC